MKLIEKEKNEKMEQLEREIKLGAVNARRSRKRWNDMITNIKMVQTKEDLEALRQFFDRQIDIKDGRQTFLNNKI